MLYFALVHSHITYGIEVYGVADKTTMNKLLILNNKILRIILNENYKCPTASLYSQFNVLPVGALYQFRVLLLMQKYVHAKISLPTALANRFHLNSQVHFHNTRSLNNLHIQGITNNQGKKSLQYQGSILWNSLPQYLKNISSPNQFKRAAKEYLLVTYFNS